MMMLQHNDLEIDNLPNRLTIFRMVLIPPVVLCLYLIGLQSFKDLNLILGHIAAWTFVIAAITDFLDGYFARKRNIVTVFGSFLDPIADKFLVVSSLVMLLWLKRVDAIIVIILVLRELYMTSLRLLATHEGFKIPVSSLGKWKTTFQMIAIPMLMVNANWLFLPLRPIGLVLIILASLLSLISATLYSLSIIKALKEKRKQKKQLSFMKDLK